MTGNTVKGKSVQRLASLYTSTVTTSTMTPRTCHAVATADSPAVFAPTWTQS